jgi:hypothetical protein
VITKSFNQQDHSIKRNSVNTSKREAPTGAERRNRMPKARQPLNAKQELFIRMTARAESRKDIMKAVFDLDIDTAPANEIHNADCKMSRWRSLPEFEGIWKDEIKKVLYAYSGEAMKVIGQQMRSKDIPWLQNKAANDLLNYGKGQIYGDEERTVHVQIEGLPDIGSPDDQE